MSAGRQRFANQHRQARSLGSHRSQQSRQVHAVGAGRREFQKPDPFGAMTRLRRLYHHPKRATIHRRHWRTQARPRHLTAIRRLAMPPLGNADAGLGDGFAVASSTCPCYGCVQRRCARAPPVVRVGSERPTSHKFIGQQVVHPFAQTACTGTSAPDLNVRWLT